MKRLLFGLLLGAGILLPFAGEAAPKQITIHENQLKRYGNNVWKSPFLTLEIPAEAADKASAAGSLPFDLAPYRGKWVQLTIRAKGENVAKPKIFYLGVKFMLKYKGADGKWYYPEKNNITGNFDQDLSFVHQVAKDAGKAELLFQLSKTSGKITYDLSTLTIEVFDTDPRRIDPKKRFASVIPGHMTEWSAVKPYPNSISCWGKNTVLKNDLLTLSIPKELADKTSSGAGFPFDLTPYRNCEIELSVHVKAKDVARPKIRHLGVKFMLKYQGENKKWHYPEINNVTGTFEKDLVIRHMVAGDAGPAQILMQLSQTSGSIVYDVSSLKIRVLGKKQNANLICQYSDAVRNRSIHRGVMSPYRREEFLNEKNFEKLRKWNVNLYRLQINTGYRRGEAYSKAVDEYIVQVIPKVLDMAQKYGIKVIIDLHMVPNGGQMRGQLSIFDSPEAVKEFCAIWERIARKFKDHPALYGYDLFNEPKQIGKTKYSYWDIQRMAAEKIRAIDPETPIYIASNMMDSQYTFDTLSPINLKNIIYEVHCYDPFLYTHTPYKKADRLAGKKRYVYPGMFYNAKWDKAAIRSHLHKVIDFANRHKAKIYVGEFSCRAGAPGGDQYLKDSIEVFEEQKWDWCYHAFCESPVWSLEYDGPSDDELVPSENNPRRKVLLKAFEKNLKSPENKTTHAVLKIPADPMGMPGLSGFNMKNSVTLTKDNASAVDGSKEDPDPSSKAVFAFNCDQENLYFGAEVTDHELMTGSRNIFTNDGFEIYLDTRNAGCIHSSPTPYFSQIVCNPENGSDPAKKALYRNANGIMLFSSMRFVSEKTGSGYIIKLALPRNALTGLEAEKMLPGVAVAWLNGGSKGFFRRCWWGGKEARSTPETYAYLVFPESNEKNLLPAAAAATEKFLKTKYQNNNIKRSAENKIEKHTGAPVAEEIVITTRGPYLKNGVLEGFIRGKAEYKNAFDYDDVVFQLDITDPDGKVETIDAFFDRKFVIRNLTCWTEFDNPGTESFRFRYLPRKKGTYKAVARIRDSKGRTAVSKVLVFKTEDSSLRGIVRKSPYDPRYLRHETGEFFFAKGYPLHFWRNYTNLLDVMIRMNLNQLALYNCNTTSIMIQDLGNNGISLCGEKGYSHFKRTYNMQSAARLDNLFHYANRRNIHVIINLLFTTWGQEGQAWQRNGFNVKNGGPCREVKEVFTSPEAIASFRNLYRYLIARYAAYPNVLCWEIMNEIELTHVYPRHQKIAEKFVRGMAAFFRKLDPYHHLISCSCNMDGLLQKMPEIDALLPHMYPMDIGEELLRTLLQDSTCGKPQFGGEVGVGHADFAYKKIAPFDHDAVPLRNSLYASLFGTGAGTVLHWWDYIVERDQYNEYAKFASFIEGLELDKENFRVSDASVRRKNVKNIKTHFELPVTAEANFAPKKAGAETKYHFRDGHIYREIKLPKREVNDAARIFALGGSFPKDLLPKDKNEFFPWKYTLSLETTSEGALTIIPYGTGKKGTVLTVRDLISGKVLKEEKIISRRKCGFSDPFSPDETLPKILIPLPKGKYELEFANTGKDYLAFRSISFDNIYDSAKTGDPDFYTHILSGEKHTLFYVRHKLSNWQNVMKEIVPPETDDALIELPVRSNGTYKVRIFDTVKGKFLKATEEKAEKGMLRLSLPAFRRDITGIIEK